MTDRFVTITSGYVTNGDGNDQTDTRRNRKIHGQLWDISDGVALGAKQAAWPEGHDLSMAFRQRLRSCWLCADDVPREGYRQREARPSVQRCGVAVSGSAVWVTRRDLYNRLVEAQNTCWAYGKPREFDSALPYIDTEAQFLAHVEYAESIAAKAVSA